MGVYGNHLSFNVIRLYTLLNPCKKGSIIWYIIIDNETHTTTRYTVILFGQNSYDGNIFSHDVPTRLLLLIETG